MRGDFSKLRFKPQKNYTSVLQQQGRVALDADANEQCAIYDYLRSTETVDVVGLVGGPIQDEGFKITVQDGAIWIGKGRYYVDGILCENEHRLSYSDQPFLVDPDPTDQTLLGELQGSSTQPASINVIQVYLQVWRRLVTALDDPGLREPALGMADTTARLQTVWRVVAHGPMSTQTQSPAGAVTANQNSATVAGSGTSVITGLTAGQRIVSAADGTQIPLEVVPLANDTNLSLATNLTADAPPAGGCCNSMHVGVMPAPNQGKMSAQTSGDSGDCSCQPTPAAGYRGLENQLYRVEIHQPGDESTATFKWSRENGCVVVAITAAPASNIVSVDSLGLDANLGFSVGDWVGITDDTHEFGQPPNQPGNLCCIQSITGLSVTMQQSVSVDLTQNPRMRRWDQFGSSATSNGISLSTALIPLENGIEVEFTQGQYASGDYWLIPARTATGAIEWPPNDSDGDVFLPPRRIEVFSAPLACIQWDGEQITVQDCREQFETLVDLTKRSQACCEITVSPRDLTGNVTLQTVADKVANATMFVQAATTGSQGNNIEIRVSNLQPDASPPTFDLTVTETDVYLALTTGGGTGIEGVIGDEEDWAADMGPLAHILAGSVNVNLAPKDNQAVLLTGGATGIAQGDVVDSNQKRVFTLQARSSGADGNLTRATISNLDTAPSLPTFDLALTWSKTLTGVSMATLFQQIQDSMAYEIVAQQPTTRAAFPVEGMTQLIGGVDANPTTGSGALAAQAGIFGTPAKICLRPGTYYLPAPLTLGPNHSNITIESCGGTAILAAASGWVTEEDFQQGLVVLNSANNIALMGLRFSMPPPVMLMTSSSFAAGLGSRQSEATLGDTIAKSSKEDVAELLARLFVSVALRPVDCANLRVENCCFDFLSEAGRVLPVTLLQAGILASGANFGLTLANNQFLAQSSPVSTSNALLQIRAGYVLTPSVTLSRISRLDTKGEDLKRIREAGTLLPAALQNACFQANAFEGLEVPLLIFAECGDIALEGNLAGNCYSGPWIIARRTPPDLTAVTAAEPAEDVYQDPMFEAALALAQCYPLPDGFQSPQTLTIPSAIVGLASSPFSSSALTFLNALMQLEFGLEQAGSQSVSGDAFDLCLRGVNNKIATYTPASNWESTGPGFVIWGEDDDFNSKVVLSSNSIENSSYQFVTTVLIVQVGMCTMTGNLVLNDFYPSFASSLFLLPLPQGGVSPPLVAVTGNMFNANTNLYSPPLGTSTGQLAGIGDGHTKVFNFVLAQVPILPSTVEVLVGTSLIGKDSGNNSITGTGISGRIDYISGATFLTLTTAPAQDVQIQVDYVYGKWVPLNGP